MSLLIQFVYLQVLDLLTTLAFLAAGGREANPVVRLALDWAPMPLGGLVLVKLLAVVMGVWCWRLGKARLLVCVNVFFSILVVWNLVALLLEAGALAQV